MTAAFSRANRPLQTVQYYFFNSAGKQGPGQRAGKAGRKRESPVGRPHCNQEFTTLRRKTQALFAEVSVVSSTVFKEICKQQNNKG
jgi:hypothetical protein